MIANFLIILIFNWFIVTILWIYSQYSKKADIIDTYWGNARSDLFIYQAGNE